MVGIVFPSRVSLTFYRLCSDLIVVPPLAQRIHENPNELEALLQVAVQRIVGEPSAKLLALVIAEGKRLYASDNH